MKIKVKHNLKQNIVNKFSGAAVNTDLLPGRLGTHYQFQVF